MSRDRKLNAVITTMLLGPLVLIILTIWYLLADPSFQPEFLTYVTVCLSGILGAAIGAYISKKNPSDERETQIFNQSSTYAWFFLFFVIPLIAMVLVNSPPPYGVYAAILLYGTWFVAIIIFSATALYRIRR